MSKESNVGDRYVLPTVRSDAQRLDIIHEVYGPLTIRGLEAAEVAQSHRVADIGCGAGTVSRWLAGRIGSFGRVDAIDVSEDQLMLARQATAVMGAATVNYQVGNAYQPGLEEGVYDLALMRLVLCHLREPAKAVAEMSRLLKPAGRVVLVDMDMYAFRAMPSSSHYTRWLEHARRHQQNIGVDYAIGTRLHELLNEAGLETTFVGEDQPVFNTGVGKHLWANTWRNALPHVVSAGSVDAREGEELIAGMEAHNQKPEVWIAVAKMFAAVGQKCS